jgi:hypothetical protein
VSDSRDDDGAFKISTFSYRGDGSKIISRVKGGRKIISRVTVSTSPQITSHLRNEESYHDPLHDLRTSYSLSMDVLIL